MRAFVKGKFYGVKNAQVGESGKMEKNILGKWEEKGKSDRNKSFAAGVMRMRCFRRLMGQGATEYLVLLAVVLIVALVSVALLGFFPGMAGDSQVAQSQMYWRSASPIAITDWAAEAYSGSGNTYPYFRLRNTGTYPITITGIVGADGNKITVFLNGASTLNISDYYYLGSGEEKYVGYWIYGVADRQIGIKSTGSTANWIGGATSLCANSASSPGTVTLSSMGFEYVIYIEGQQVTKRQVGKQVVIKCLPPG